MAVNGGEPQTGAATQYYAVTDTAGLVNVLGQIIGKAVSCTIPLAGVSGNLDKVAVSAKDASGNTIEIMQDSLNGWSYTDANKTAIIYGGGGAIGCALTGGAGAGTGAAGAGAGAGGAAPGRGGAASAGTGGCGTPTAGIGIVP